MVSGVEVPSWVGRDLRVGCVVVCGREREREGEGRRGRERGSRLLSILILLTPAGLIPCRANPLRDPLPELLQNSPTYTLSLIHI